MTLPTSNLQCCVSGVKLNKYIKHDPIRRECIQNRSAQLSVYTNAEKTSIEIIRESADTVEVTTKELCVLDREIAKRIIAKFTCSATKGARLLKFFVTAKGNPYFIIVKQYLRELIRRCC